MRILATTCHRMADPKSDHGSLIEIDWASKEIIRYIDAPPLYAELGHRNRGGRRGLRGITEFGGLIWFAASDSLWGLTPETLELRRIISHPWMSNVHEIEGSRDGIWVTSTGGNGIFLIGVDQQIIKSAWLCGEPSEDLRILFDQDEYHINTVFETDDAIYAYSNVTGQVFRMVNGSLEEEIKLEERCHNVVLTEFGWFRSQSRESRVLIGDRAIDMPRRGKEGEFTLPGWLRGMARCPNGNFLVGTSPASIYEIDPHEMRIVDELVLSDNVAWTLHGVFIDADRPIVRPPEAEVQVAQRKLDNLFSEVALLARRNGSGRANSIIKRAISRARRYARV